MGSGTGAATRSVDAAAEGSRAAVPQRRTHVLAVVPTLDVGSPRLARLLTSLEGLTDPPSLEVVVVANRAADLPVEDSVQRAVAPPGVTLIEPGLNLGFGGSMNLATSSRSFTHLWMLQDDLVVHPGCLTSLLSTIDLDASLGAVSPTRIDAMGIVRRHHEGGILTEDGRIASMLPEEDAPLEEYIPHGNPDFVMSRGMLVRAAAWQDVGGMDARFYPVGWSDVDFCWRLRSHGWRFTSCPDATVEHLKGTSTPRTLGLVTFQRNGAIHRAKRDGRLGRPEIHPDLSRETLAIIAQSASALVLDLAQYADRQDLEPPGRPRAGLLVDAVVAGAGRILRSARRVAGR